MTENDWCSLDGEPMKVADARRLPFEQRSRALVRLENGALVRPWRFTLSADEALAEVSAVAEDAPEEDPKNE